MEGPDVVVEHDLADSVARIYLNRPHRLNAVVPEPVFDTAPGTWERA